MKRCLSIAGISILLRGDAEDAEMVDGRYGPFLIEPCESPSAAIDLALYDPPQQMPWSGESLKNVVTGPAFHLSSDGFSAHIKSDGSYAALEAPRLERCLDAVLRYVLSRQLVDRGGLLLHASAIVRGGRAWIFAGPSGVGKTTISQNIKGTLLGDEAIALVIHDGQLVCHSTPYWRATPASAPAAALVFPTQGAPNAVALLSPGRALGKLLSCVGPLLPSAQDNVMILADRVVGLGSGRLFDVQLESIEAIQSWLEPQIDDLPVPLDLIE